MKLPVKMTINGQSVSHEVEPRLLLVHYIRENVGLKDRLFRFEIPRGVEVVSG